MSGPENTLASIFAAVFNNGLFIVRRPVMEWNKCTPKCHAKFGQLIVHAWWDDREQRARDDAVRFQPLQGQRKHALRDAADPPLDFVVAKRASGKSADYQNRPLVADAHQNFGEAFAGSRIERFRGNNFVRFAQNTAFLWRLASRSILALRTDRSRLVSQTPLAGTNKGHDMQTPVDPQTQAPTQNSDAKSLHRNKIIYWTLTLLMFVPGTIGAFAEAFTSGPASIVKIMLALGYPLYLMKILGTFKIFGGIVILTGKLPRMKEWAYAGFSIELLGATASHVITGDVKYALFPFSFFMVLVIAYILWHKTAATPLPFKDIGPQL